MPWQRLYRTNSFRDAVAGVQFYTRNTATDFQKAPLFTLDMMGLKRFDNGVGVGVIVGTVQQLGKDKAPTADKLNGFVGYDWAVGPILTYDTKLGGKAPLSFSLRWVPTVSSKNRLEGNSTVMATATLIFSRSRLRSRSHHEESRNREEQGPVAALLQSCQATYSGSHCLCALTPFGA